MKTPPKLSSLADRLKIQKTIIAAREGTQAHALMVVAMLERFHEVRSLDIEILDLERLCARISETQKPQYQRFRIGPFKIDIVVSDRGQLRLLIELLKTWRDALLGKDGDDRLALAMTLAGRLADMTHVKKSDDDDEPPPSSMNGGAAMSRWGE